MQFGADRNRLSGALNDMHNNQRQPNVLVLDTSNQYCSVALQWRGQVRTRHEWSEQKHSQMILPLVRQLLNELEADFAGLDAVVVGVGPGGFTGVRLAVAVAQGLAFSAHKPLLAFSSLAALAVAGLRDRSETEVMVAMDARMQQVYWAHYRMSSEGLHAVVEPSLDDVALFVKRLQAMTTACVVVGNAIEAFDSVAQACARAPLSVARMTPSAQSAPQAVDFLPLVECVWHEDGWLDGVALSPEQVQPLYVRDKVAQTIAEREGGASA